MRKTIISAAASLVVLAFAWPANAAPTEASQATNATDDVAFVTTMQELGATADQICCDATCGGIGLLDLNRCAICCPPPAFVPHCYCNDGIAVCECEVIDNGA